MAKLEIDYTFRNREEAEKYWNEPTGLDTRLQRVFVVLVAILAIPLEFICEVFLIILGFIARYGSMILWMTNPIEKKQTESEEES